MPIFGPSGTKLKILISTNIEEYSLARLSHAFYFHMAKSIQICYFTSIKIHENSYMTASTSSYDV